MSKAASFRRHMLASAVAAVLVIGSLGPVGAAGAPGSGDHMLPVG